MSALKASTEFKESATEGVPNLQNVSSTKEMKLRENVEKVLAKFKFAPNEDLVESLLEEFAKINLVTEKPKKSRSKVAVAGLVANVHETEEVVAAIESEVTSTKTSSTCQGTKTSGGPCNRKTSQGELFCKSHAKQNTMEKVSDVVVEEEAVGAKDEVAMAVADSKPKSSRREKLVAAEGDITLSLALPTATKKASKKKSGGAASTAAAAAKTEGPTSVNVWPQDIGGIVYYIDAANNIYKAEEVLAEQKNPSIVGKYSLVNGKYNLVEYHCA